ncbi:MAG: hypothetical protein ACR5K7_00505 [Symbiopectobacterium sp.]
MVGSRGPNVKAYLLGSNATAIVRHAMQQYWSSDSVLLLCDIVHQDAPLQQ